MRILKSMSFNLFKGLAHFKDKVRIFHVQQQNELCVNIMNSYKKNTWTRHFKLKKHLKHYKN